MGGRMRVMVTGATGFVGGHTAKALIDAGHGVTALVRDERRLRAVADGLGFDLPDHVVGDMTDQGAVEAALDGADAVVHCAALVSLDRRAEAEMLRANSTGFRNVVAGAVARGLDPVVHTSSTSALFQPGVGRLHPELPVAECTLAYGRSKAQCEAEARRLQEQGAPVVITYPSGILGPPAGQALGETAEQMSSFLAGGVMPTRHAAISVIDVRDLAALHAALVEPGRGPRRVMCGGHLLTMEQLAELFRELTGRRFPIPPVPPGALRTAGRAADLLRRVVPLGGPMSEEAMSLVTCWEGTDDATLAELGVTLRAPRETMEVSLRAWRDAGLITAGQFGRPLAGSASAVPARPVPVQNPAPGMPRGLRWLTAVKVPGVVLASRPFRWLGPKVFPRFHRLVLRASGGRTMLDSKAQPMLMLTTVGARSGERREAPVATVPLERGTYLVVGSNFARDRHPAWTGNLLAHPDAEVTFRGRSFAVTARLLTGEERAACWDEALEWYPGWRDYLEVTDREFRVFELTPT
jgi:deazaflavin-dependent oxidoreductase (nitroreductase family)